MTFKFHHVAFNITPGSLEFVIELFAKLGCEMTYREEGARWCLLKQPASEIRLQIIETDELPVPTEKKINSHIAFLSPQPKKDLIEIQNWLATKNIEFEAGEWSERELWLDLPKIFTNFVIEVMDESVVA